MGGSMFGRGDNGQGGEIGCLDLSALVLNAS